MTGIKKKVWPSSTFPGTLAGPRSEEDLTPVLISDGGVADTSLNMNHNAGLLLHLRQIREGMLAASPQSRV